MPIYKRIVFGILAFVLFAAGIIGLAVPIMPQFLPLLLSLFFFRLARIPVLSKAVIKLGAMSLLTMKEIMRFSDRKLETRMRFKFYLAVRKVKAYGNKLVGRKSKPRK